MASNPFDEEDGVYRVLRNGEGQYSLWPAAIAVPGGWEVVHADDTRQACLGYIAENWRDMRPTSLVTAMEKHGGDLWINSHGGGRRFVHAQCSRLMCMHKFPRLKRHHALCRSECFCTITVASVRSGYTDKQKPTYHLSSGQAAQWNAEQQGEHVEFRAK